VIKYIKKSKSSVSKSDDNEDIKITVESIISDIRENGDKAVRKNSTKFDKWDPKTFILTRDEVTSAQSKLSKSQIEDIKFAQNKLRILPTSIRYDQGLRGETLPGVF